MTPDVPRDYSDFGPIVTVYLRVVDGIADWFDRLDTRLGGN